MQLAKMLQRLPPTRDTDDAFDVPRTFIGFLEWVGVTPRPGQAEFARVAFDGVQPVDRDMAVTIFGNLDFENLPMGVRRVVAAVVGGRGGKTYLLIALRLVWGMLVRNLSPLAPGEEAFATVVAPNDDLREQAVNFGLGVCRSKPEIKKLLRLPRGTKDTDVPSEFGLYRPDFDRVVTFAGAVATRGGYGVRGRWHTDLALDECCFFRDASAKVNDKDIFDAGVSRVLPDGQVILGSTPWAKAGLLYEIYRDNYGKPTTALVAHAPTLVLNPSDYTRSVVAMETKRDPDNAAREYGAQFMEGSSVIFFGDDLIESCVDESLNLETPRVPAPGDEIAAGGDLGFRSNSSALAVTHLSRGLLILAELLEKKPEPGKPLRPKATLATFKERMLAHGIDVLMGDQHYRETADEELSEAGLTFVDAPATPDVVYVRARQKMREGVVRIPRHPKLLRQLKEVHGRPLPGGRMQIILPQWAKGEHGDLVSAYVLSLWQLVTERVADSPPEPGTREHEAMLVEKRRAAFQEKQDKPAWMPNGAAVDRGARAHWRR